VKAVSRTFRALADPTRRQILQELKERDLAAGEIAARFGQPVMIGEILAGIILGPSVLNYVDYNNDIKVLAQLGVLLLVFIAGMEMDLDALWKSFRGRGAWVSAAGFVIPLLCGVILGLIFHLDQTRTIFIGLCIAITALPVSVRILMDLGKLQTEVGQKIVSAAVANDVVSLLALGIILNLKGGNGSREAFFKSVGLALGKALLFMVVVFIAARLVKRYPLGRLFRPGGSMQRFFAKLNGKEALFAIVLLFVIAFASFSEFLGLDFVIGAFFGSMLLSHELLGKTNFEEIEKTASSVTMGFLGPIFFAAIGLEFDARTLENWPLRWRYALKSKPGVTAILVMLMSPETVELERVPIQCSSRSAVELTPGG